MFRVGSGSRLGHETIDGGARCSDALDWWSGGENVQYCASRGLA
jgi:hypothetical protein